MRRLTTILLLALSITVSAQVKISELPAASSMGSADKFVIVQSGSTKYMVAEKISDVISDSANVLRLEMSDTAQTLRTSIAYLDGEVHQAISDSINSVINNIVLDSSSVDQDALQVGAVSSLFYQSIASTHYTSAGSQLGATVYFNLLNIRDKIRIKCVWDGGVSQTGEVGQVQIHDYPADATVWNTSTEDLFGQGAISGIMEIELTMLTGSDVGVLWKVYTYNDTPESTDLVRYRYQVLDVGSVPDAYLTIHTIVAVDAYLDFYSAEYIFYDPKYLIHLSNL